MHIKTIWESGPVAVWLFFSMTRHTQVRSASGEGNGMTTWKTTALYPES